MKDWKDIFMDEDAPEQPKTDLPTDNEKKGEDNGQGSEAAGALSENDDPQGMKTVPAGEDEITGEKSTDYADVFSFLDEGDDEEKKEEEEKGDEPAEEGEEEEKKEGEEPKADRKKKAAKKRRNSFSIFDEDAPEQPKTDLPTDNEKAGEDNGQGSEAAGALSENDDPKGMKTVPAGEDEITGEKSTDYADFFSLLDEGDDEEKKEEEPAKEGEESEGDEEAEEKPAEEEKKDCGGSKKRKKAKRNFWTDEEEQPEDNDEAEGDEDEDEKKEDKPAEGDEEAKQDKKKRRRNFWEDADGEDEGSDDDGASEKEPVGKPDAEEGKEEKEEKKEEKEEEATQDWSSFFDEGFEEPENLPGDPKQDEPGKVNGEEVCPNGCADLPEKQLTEPVLVPVETKNGEQGVLQNRRHVSDRYFFN